MFGKYLHTASVAVYQATPFVFDSIVPASPLRAGVASRKSNGAKGATKPDSGAGASATEGGQQDAAVAYLEEAIDAAIDGAKAAYARMEVDLPMIRQGRMLPSVFRSNAMDNFCHAMEDVSAPGQAVREWLQDQACMSSPSPAVLERLAQIGALRPVMRIEGDTLRAILARFRASLLSTANDSFKKHLPNPPKTEPERSRAVRDWYLAKSARCRWSALEVFGLPKQAIHMFDMIRGIESPEDDESKKEAFKAVDECILKSKEATLFRIWISDLAK